MSEDEFINETKRLIYEKEWHISMFDDLKHDREFFLTYYERGYTPRRMLNELERDGY